MFGRSKNTFIFFLILLIAGFFLRFYSLDKNLFFGPEQGRDLLVVKDIAENFRLTLIGARTEIDGVFYGPFYYYLLLIPFYLTQGNPLGITLFLIILNLLGIPAIYYLGKKLFDKYVGIFAAILYTFSFGVIVSSRWLSHPPLAIPFSLLFFLCLVNFLKGNKFWLFGAAISFGLLGQTQFLSYIFFSFILVGSILLFQKRFFKESKIFLLSSMVLLLITAYGSFLLFDLRHNFLISKNIFLLLTRKTGFYISFISSINRTLHDFIEAFSFALFPFSFLLGCVFMAVLSFAMFRAYKEYKQSLLIVGIWILSPVFVFITLRHEILEHYFMSILAGFILAFAVLIQEFDKIKPQLGKLLLIGVVVINIIAWKYNIPVNGYLFFQATQPQMTYEDQRKVIDTIYKEADNKKFSIQAYTIPYWLQEGWEYLFWYHGQEYGYLPIPEKASKLFVIIQDDPGNKLYQNMWLKDTVVHWGTEVKSFRIGIYTIKVLQVKKI